MAEGVVVPAAEVREPRFETVAGPIHTVVLLIVLAAITVLGYLSARSPAAANTSRLLFYLPTMAWEWLVFGYIYWGVRRHGKRFRDIAGEPWKDAMDFFRDIAITVVAWIVSLLVLAVVAHLLHMTGSVEAARRLAPHGVLESLLWIALAITAGVCEETIFRGYLQKQLGAWFRNAPVAIVLSALLFGAGHIYQGLRPAMVIAVFGSLFGILAHFRKNLRPGIMMHAWHDTISGFLVRVLPK